VHLADFSSTNEKVVYGERKEQQRKKKENDA
jgi:hypothetical protein